MEAGIQDNPQQDFVLKTVKGRDVHFIRCWFTDVLGNMKSFSVVPGELEGAFREGMGFDGSAIEGFSSTQESDMLAYPDASTFQVLPWRPESNAVARMFCNIKTPDGRPFEGDPRHILENVMEDASSLGYSINVGTELEYFYFKDQDGTVVLDQGSSFDLTSLDYASDLRRDTVLTLEKMGIPVEYSHHEMGASQHEIDLRYTDALSMGDAVMTYKLIVKEIALKHQVYASFMPKPMTDEPGSGMHLHLSLWNEDGENAFFDESDPSGYNLSKTARSFIAGMLEHSREFCLVTNQYVNSFKRLAARITAPTAIAWARDNRSTIARIPGYRPKSPDACRLELRSPDPAANPYLALAAVIASGLDGVKRGLEAPHPMESHDFFKLDATQMRELGVESLPTTLGEAVDAFKGSDFMKSVLGEHVHSYLVRQKQDEWDSYQRTVTPWELDRCLAVL